MFSFTEVALQLNSIMSCRNSTDGFDQKTIAWCEFRIKHACRNEVTCSYWSAVHSSWKNARWWNLNTHKQPTLSITIDRLVKAGGSLQLRHASKRECANGFDSVFEPRGVFFAALCTSSGINFTKSAVARDVAALYLLCCWELLPSDDSFTLLVINFAERGKYFLLRPLLLRRSNFQAVMIDDFNLLCPASVSIFGKLLLWSVFQGAVA